MRLKSICYKENHLTAGANPWELEKLSLGERNLIVGKNATGKTRIIHVINNLARLIKTQQIFNGEWTASFIDESNDSFEFSIAYENGKVIKEQISINSQKKLERTSSLAQIFSDITLEWQTIFPPNDRLVLHVRRDEKEFPFLENLVLWADGVRGFSFANTSPNLIEIPEKPSQLISLNAVPSALEQLSSQQLKKVINQLNEIGYDLEAVSTGVVTGLQPTAKMILFKERGIANLLKQFEISQGMFRAFSVLTIFEFLRSSGSVGTILVDDFGEGLDFERSKKLAEIIFEDQSESQIQFVMTSNDSFLMNTVPLTELTICYRSIHKVKCLNYSNSKDKFDEWQQLGLNNFDLLTSNFLNQ
ncbi:MAG: hypothetical protein CK425_06165 [Parachlamydia sp.]|nr:MAG: hypothetical protein CK425_06165 [Parachlamydia sp.]